MKQNSASRMSGVVERPMISGVFAREHGIGRDFLVEFYPDRLSLFKTTLDQNRAFAPEVEIFMANIEDVEQLTGGFTLHLADGVTETLQGPREGDLDEWVDVLRTRLAPSLDTVLFKGIMWKKRGKKLEERFFVLFLEHLDYYAEVSGYEGGQPVRGTVSMADVEGFQETDEGFAIDVAGQQVLFEAKSEDKERWSAAFDHVLRHRDEKIAIAAEDEQRQEEEEEEEEEPEEVLCEGVLRSERRGAIFERYYVLLPSELQYFGTSNDYHGGEPARGLVVLKEVNFLQEIPEGMELVIGSNKPVRFLTYNEKERQMWFEAFSGLLLERLGPKQVVALDRGAAVDATSSAATTVTSAARLCGNSVVLACAVALALSVCVHSKP